MFEQLKQLVGGQRRELIVVPWIKQYTVKIQYLSCEHRQEAVQGCFSDPCLDMESLDEGETS